MPYIMKVATGELPELGVFGDDYDTNSYIKVTQTCDDKNDCTYKYYMCLADKTGHGFGEKEEKDIVESVVSMSNATCTAGQNP